MSMSRKHFQDIAEELKNCRIDTRRLGMEDSILLDDQWSSCVKAMADVCNRHNSNFNRSRFYEACGLDN